MAVEAEFAGKRKFGGETARLLEKEWVVFTLRERLFLFAVFLLASLQTVYFDEAFFILGLTFSAALALYVPAVEWYRKADLMLHSLPVRRSAVVVSRYLIALFAALIGWAAWTAAGRLLLPILDAGRSAPAFGSTFIGALTFLVAAVLFFACYLPLYFRLGLGRSAASFVILALGLLVLGYGTAGLAAGPGGLAQVGMFPPSSLISFRVERLIGALGPAAAIAIILAGSAAVIAVSLLLSLRGIEKREF